MKTIQVSDEVYDFLKSCQEELNTQDNRSTSNPIFGFEVEKEGASYDPQEYVFINKDHTDRITNTEEEDWEQELATYIIDSYDNPEELTKDLYDIEEDCHWTLYREIDDENIDSKEAWAVTIKNEITDYIKGLDYYEYESFFEEFNIRVYGYEKIWVPYYKSFSIFESDMQSHIDLNKHNMDKYRTYVFSTFRTPKMNKLKDIIKDEIVFICNCPVPEFPVGFTNRKNNDKIYCVKCNLIIKIG